MTQKISSGIILKAVHELEDIYERGEAVRLRILEEHGHNAVLLVGEVMELRATARDAAEAAGALLESCDEPEEE